MRLLIGSFAEFTAVPKRSVFKIPKEMQLEMQRVCLKTALTPYHTLKGAVLKINQFLVVFGASGNTRTMATQFGMKMGAKVVEVSR